MKVKPLQVRFALSENHWRMEEYTERMTTKQWKEVLLEERDVMIFRGHCRRLKAKRLGYGVVEVYKSKEDFQS
jgi:hypothetical protein